MQDEKSVNLVAAIALVTISTPIIIVLSAFAISKLWLWFAVPLGVPPVGMAHAYGISLLVLCLVWWENKQNERKWYETLIASWLRPVVFLAVGYVAHRIMG